MEILSLRTFQALIDEGGIKGASKKLNTVPSNVTARIHKLEQELDTKLFNLVGRKLEITEQGRVLSEYANQILRLEYQASAAISQAKGSYELRVGAPETFTAVHLPMVLQRLKQQHPQIKARIVTATSWELIQAVLDNKVDCAMVGNAVAHESLCIVPVVQEELVIVTPVDTEHDPVLFVRDEGCGYRDWAIARQREHGGSEELMVMSSADGILGCIAAGMGYTVIGRDMVSGSRYERALRTEPLGEQGQFVQISIVYQRDNPLVESIQCLLRQFR